MSVSVIKPGLQSTIQSRPRIGLRHLGVPASGAADPLSLALANRLVANRWDAPAIEATLLGPELEFDSALAFALAGGNVSARLNGDAVDSHETVFAEPGDLLRVGPVETGARVYIAVAGGFAVDAVLGSASTYVPAELGGHEGRALRGGDRLSVAGSIVPHARTPAEFRPPMTSSWALRACPAPETGSLTSRSCDTLFDANWTIARRADRTGLQLDGERLEVESDGRMPSAAVFPGTVQCPEDGVPFVLSVDAGTVGGYPRVAQVARADRHQLGQFRPGDHVRLLRREPDEAIAELRAKIEYWREWLPEIAAILL